MKEQTVLSGVGVGGQFLDFFTNFERTMVNAPTPVLWELVSEMGVYLAG